MGKGRQGNLRLKDAWEERKVGLTGSLELGAYPIHHHVGSVMDSIVRHPELCGLKNSVA